MHTGLSGGKGGSLSAGEQLQGASLDVEVSSAMQLSRRDDALLLPEPVVLHLLHRVPLHRAVLHHEPGEYLSWLYYSGGPRGQRCQDCPTECCEDSPAPCTVAVGGAGLRREEVLSAASFPPYSKRFAPMKPARHCA